MTHLARPVLPPRLRLPTLALLALLTLLLGACAALPPRTPTEPSQAYTDTGATTLARVAAGSLVAAGANAGAPSGFRLLPTGVFAFNARIALVQAAERAIDLQYYHIHNDQTGQALLRELRKAAARGVRVRLLVDDFHAASLEPLLADLATCPGVQVRLFNPLPLRWGPPVLRLALSPGEFERHNHRMHNKLLVADNALAIYGGRNIADEYFMNHAETNFVDLDLLSAGPLVHELSTVFDTYWNSDAAWPVRQVLGLPEASVDTNATAAAQARFDAAVRLAAPLVPDQPLDPLGQTAPDVQLAQGRLVLVAATARVFADPPTKASHVDTGAAIRPTAAMQGVLATMAVARREVVITSPYFLPGDVGMPMMREAARLGGRTVIYTNSLDSTDEPLVHDKYSQYRVEMLRLGVQIHEFSPVQVQRSRSFGVFGKSTPRLHAKMAVVDQRWLAVGSVNLDARSAIGNTEMSVVIDSPALAQAANRLISGDIRGDDGGPQAMYRLHLQADGHTIEWRGTDEQGRPTGTTDEPGNHPWLRFKLWLQSLVVDERLL